MARRLWEAIPRGLPDDEEAVSVGGTALGCGYAWAALRRVERPVSPELMRFHRDEQMLRLKSPSSVHSLDFELEKNRYQSQVQRWR